MPKPRKKVARPRRVVRNGRAHDRVTLRFKRLAGVDEDRARVQDALVRAGGYRLLAGLTADVARRLGRWRGYVASSAVAGLLRRLRRLLREDAIVLWIAGRRVAA